MTTLKNAVKSINDDKIDKFIEKVNAQILQLQRCKFLAVVVDTVKSLKDMLNCEVDLADDATLELSIYLDNFYGWKFSLNVNGHKINDINLGNRGEDFSFIDNITDHGISQGRVKLKNSPLVEIRLLQAILGKTLFEEYVDLNGDKM